MNSIAGWIEQNVGQLSSKLRLDPVNEIHLPSFVLGCSVMISVSLLGPFVKMFVGGLLLTVITLVKYVVIIGGITACVLVVTSKNKTGKSSKEKTAKQPSDPVPKLEELQKESTTVKKTEVKTELAKDDFESIKYYDIPKVKSEIKRAPTDNAYNRFINRAGFKDSGHI